MVTDVTSTAPTITPIGSDANVVHMQARLGSLALVTLLCLGGCGESHAAFDVGVDAAEIGVDAAESAASCDLPNGAATCASGNIVVCCDGVRETDVDGPCLPSPPLDASIPACESGSWPGCPCDVEGAVTCGYPYDRWQRECIGGVWVEHASTWCCR